MSGFRDGAICRHDAAQVRDMHHAGNIAFFVQRLVHPRQDVRIYRGQRCGEPLAEYEDRPVPASTETPIERSSLTSV